MGIPEIPDRPRSPPNKPPPPARPVPPKSPCNPPRPQAPRAGVISITADMLKNMPVLIPQTTDPKTRPPPINFANLNIAEPNNESSAIYEEINENESIVSRIIFIFISINLILLI